jgi:outer membrane biosynthesis protein TonB
MSGVLRWSRPRLVVAVLLALPLAALVVPARGRAAPGPPAVTKPVISGEAREGRTLTATATWTGDPEPTVSWQWLRCARSNGQCTAIPGATSSQHTVTGDDVGFAIRVQVQVTNDQGSAEERSQPTALVTAAPPPEPTPSPTPSPSPSPDPDPSPSPSPSVSPDPSPSPSLSPDPDPGTSGSADAAITPAPATSTGTSGTSLVGDGTTSTAGPLRLLRPFPIVRIKGRLTSEGARVTLLTVRAPRGTRIRVRCRGGSCPARKLARTATLTRFRALESDLAAGTRIDVTVTSPRRIGKWTTIRIRLGAPPRRWDRCVLPGGRSPVTCPTG